MPSTQALLRQIKAELKHPRISNAQLAEAMDLSESSVKRMFAAGGEMPLLRMDEIGRVLKTDFAVWVQKLVADAPERRELSLAQERAVVADPTLLLTAICCLSQRTFEPIVDNCVINEAEATRHLAQLDRLGIVELRPPAPAGPKAARGRKAGLHPHRGPAQWAV